MESQQLNTKIQYIIIAIMIGLLVLSIFPMENALGNTLSERAVLLMFGFLGIGLLSLVLRQQKIMYAGMICCGILSLFLKGESNGSIVFPTKNNLQSFKILHLNLSSISDDYEDAIKQIRELEPDIISFQEVTPEWNAFLKMRLSGQYPFDETVVKIDPHGKALYAKQELFQRQTYQSSQRPLLGVGYRKNGKQVRVISCYLSQSVNRQGLVDAQQTLDVLSDVVNNAKEPIIVLGDFNLVYWSSEIRQFRSNTGLNNSRRSIALSSLDVPFDHIFYTEGIECVEFEDITLNNSHFGIIGTYQFELVN